MITQKNIKAKRTSLDLINQVNRPFLFLGLRVEYAVIYFVILLLLSIKFITVTLVILGTSLPILSRLNKENKGGNPNFLKATINFMNLKKYYLDQRGLLKFLSQHGGD